MIWYADEAAKHWVLLTFLERRIRRSKVPFSGGPQDRFKSVALYLWRNDGNFRQIEEIQDVIGNFGFLGLIGGRAQCAKRLGWSLNRLKQTRRRIERVARELFPPSVMADEGYRDSALQKYVQALAAPMEK